MFEVRISPPASRYFKKLRDKNLKARFRTAIEEISENPGIGTPKKGDLAGIYGYDLYYHRTNYEIAYTVEEKDGVKVIVIVMAGTRENFYEQLKNYWL